MKILSTKRYNELVAAEKQVGFALNEVKRKEFCIQRKQRTINNISNLLNKLTKNAKKEELKTTLDKIFKEINN